MTWQLWVPVIGGISGFLILFSTWIFKLFPSIEGMGERILRWLCTYGPLWPINRVIRARALGRSINPTLSHVDAETSQQRLDTSSELWALLDPVMERHPTWFTDSDMDAEGVKHPYKHRFIAFRTAWCLFWRGEPYAKFQARRKELNRQFRM